MLNRSLLAITACATFAVAQDQPGAEVSGTWGFDVPTKYFFRGIIQENQGIILQPYLELSYNLMKEEGTLSELNMTFGVWNSLHEGPSGTGGGTAMWYEGDFYLGFSGKVAEKWTVGTVYTAYHSPNGRFATVQEIAFSAAYDDTGLFGESFPKLNPAATLAFETSGQADAGGSTGIYLQLGIEPSFGIWKNESYDLTLATPVTLGLSLGDYYESPVDGDDSFLGFLDIGGVLSTPLPFMPARLGPWTGNFGLHVLFLGDTNEDFNNAIGSGDAVELIASLGMSTTF
jgi:hypothetical protein